MKYLYTLPSGPLRPYPRQDDEPVVGLDTAAFAVLLVQQDPEPEYNSDSEYLAPQETITLGEPEGVLRRTWQVLPIPPAPEQARWVEFGQAVLGSAELGQMYEVAAPTAGAWPDGWAFASREPGRPAPFCHGMGDGPRAGLDL